MVKAKSVPSLAMRTAILPSLLAYSQQQHLSRLLSLRISLQRSLNLVQGSTLLLTPLGLQGLNAAESRAVKEKLEELLDVAEQLRNVENRGVATALRKRRKPELDDGDEHDEDDEDEHDDDDDDKKKKKSKSKKSKKGHAAADSDYGSDESFASMKSSVWSPALDAVRRSIDLASGFAGASGQVGGGSLASLRGGAGGAGGAPAARSSSSSSSVLQASFWSLVDGTLAHEKFGDGVDKACSAEALSAFKASLPSSLASSLDPSVLASLLSSSTFDDSKLYREQLKDFVASGSSGDNAPGAARLAADGTEEGDKGGRGQGGKPKGKAPNGVDRRASKGRKIKTAVHTKIVNYCFPVRRKAQAGGGGAVDDDDWFKSLFGGALRGAKAF